jgi:hypothetical protein
MNRFVWLLSHDEVNQERARDLGAVHGLAVQVRLIKEGLPDGDCRALVVDLDSVAPDRRALLGLVKELGGRAHAYPVAAFGYSLEEDELRDLRAAGVQVFHHGLGPELFAAITEQAPRTSSDGFSVPST